MRSQNPQYKVWWSIESPNVGGLLGTGWLCEQPNPRWNLGVAHWPIMFRTRKAAREEVQGLVAKYAHLGWSFRSVKLLVTYRVHKKRRKAQA